MGRHLGETRYVATPELRARLREQGRQSIWLARQIGVSKSHFHHILNGRRPITQANARIIAAALGADFFVLWKVSEGDKSVPFGKRAVA